MSPPLMASSTHLATIYAPDCAAFAHRRRTRPGPTSTGNIVADENWVCFASASRHAEEGVSARVARAMASTASGDGGMKPRGLPSYSH